MRRAARLLLRLALPAAALGALSGCLERRLYITSDPPGALVRLNDVDMGRTPLEVDFEWYGTYDVRLELDGYEPIATSAEADMPVQEWPGIDLVTMALPMKFKNEVRWHFALEPQSTDPADAIARGRDLRAMMAAQVVEPAPTDTGSEAEIEIDVAPAPESEAESFPPIGGEEDPSALEPVTEPIGNPPESAPPQR